MFIKLFISFTLLFTFLGCGKNPCRKIEKRYRQYRAEFAEVPDISFQQLSSFTGKYQLIDVREKKEQDVSMLKNAITAKEFLISTPKKDTLYIPYCTIGYRSGRFSQKLMKKGIQVKNLKGGILGWICAGGEVFKDGKVIKKAHTYGSQWEYLPENYEAVY